MIRPTDLPAVAAALRHAVYRFIGVRPLTNQHLADEPCIVLGEHTLISLDMALQEARAMWPNAEAWQLIGSDLELVRTAESHPKVMAAAPESIMSPRGRILRSPVELAAFHTA